MGTSRIGQNQRSMCATIKIHMADEKLYQSIYQGSGTFLITKPKRKKTKLRQSRLKGTKRGARK